MGFFCTKRKNQKPFVANDLIVCHGFLHGDPGGVLY